MKKNLKYLLAAIFGFCIALAVALTLFVIGMVNYHPEATIASSDQVSFFSLIGTKQIDFASTDEGKKLNAYIKAKLQPTIGMHPYSNESLLVSDQRTLMTQVILAGFITLIIGTALSLRPAERILHLRH